MIAILPTLGIEHFDEHSYFSERYWGLEARFTDNDYYGWAPAAHFANDLGTTFVEVRICTSACVVTPNNLIHYY